MKILEESQSNSCTAWCVDRKGKIIPLRVHPFGALDDDAVEDAAWLWVVNDIIDDLSLISYIANQLCYDYHIDTEWTPREVQDLVEECLEDIESLKGFSGVHDLAIEVSAFIEEQRNDSKADVELSSMTINEVNSLKNQIKKHLNENYLRVRYGSEYQNYTEREGALYFRTSSTDGFNWYSIILKFLESMPSFMNVREITVERDRSATGERMVYIDHMSTEKFLSERSFVLESVEKCGTIRTELYK